MENEQFYKASIEKQSHTSCQFEKTHEAPFRVTVIEMDCQAPRTRPWKSP